MAGSNDIFEIVRLWGVSEDVMGVAVGMDVEEHDKFSFEVVLEVGAQ